MRSRRPLLGAVAAIACALALAATVPAEEPTSDPPRIEVYPARLPDGTGRDIAERACLICHSARLISQQAKDSANWEKTLVQMAKWGAPMDSLERDTLRTYLVRTLGPSARPKPPQNVAPPVENPNFQTSPG